MATTIASTLPISSTNPASTLPVSSTIPASTLPATSLPVTSITVPASSTTATDPVTAAIKKLSKTAIANLWEEKVTNAPWYTKLFGLISYAWNRSTAAAADKQFGATIENFNKASAELVQAVANRRFTPEEAASLGIPELQFGEAENQMSYAQWNLEAKQKLKAFYDVFKERITQLNVGENSDEFGVYAAAAQKVINDLSQSKELLPNLKYPATLPIRIQTTLQDFNGKIFDDMVAAYAHQPIANITIDSFKQKAALIKGFFSAIDNVDIEAEIRKAIKAKHDTAAIDGIRAEFANPAADAAHLVTAKAAIETKLVAERSQLQAELDALRGSTGFNGTLHTAFQERQVAESEMNQAKAVYVTQRGAFGSVARADTPVSELIGLADADPRIDQAKAHLIEKARVFQEKHTAYETLTTRFNEIAQYHLGTNNLNGGKLFEINANLQPAAVEAAARTETAKVANFYNELNLVVGKNNKAVRSQQLHRIID